MNKIIIDSDDEPFMTWLVLVTSPVAWGLYIAGTIIGIYDFIRLATR